MESAIYVERCREVATQVGLGAAVGADDIIPESGVPRVFRGQM